MSAHAAHVPAWLQAASVWAELVGRGGLSDQKIKKSTYLRIEKLNFWESPVKIRDVAGTPKVRTDQSHTKTVDFSTWQFDYKELWLKCIVSFKVYVLLFFVRLGRRRPILCKCKTEIIKLYTSDPFLGCQKVWWLYEFVFTDKVDFSYSPTQNFPLFLYSAKNL